MLINQENDHEKILQLKLGYEKALEVSIELEIFV